MGRPGLGQDSQERIPHRRATEIPGAAKATKLYPFRLGRQGQNHRNTDEDQPRAKKAEWAARAYPEGRACVGGKEDLPLDSLR